MHHKIFFLVFGFFGSIAVGSVTKENIELCVKLHEAIKEHNSDAAFLALGKGADPNCKNQNGDTSVHLFARHSLDLLLLIALVNKGADLGAGNLNNETALMVAIQEQNVHVVGWLFSLEPLSKNSGVNIDQQNNEGQTALHIAVSIPSHSFVYELLSKGADKNIKDNRKQTACDIANNNGWDNIVKLFEPHEISHENLSLSQ